ncbi:MAG: hypothetical protein NXY57DRAFT_1077279 [Lentinula lateritia]|nr:MAG: hypothetical protein NXY57DRAFT_1077279 [Lentinula lateritia]
MGYMKVWLCTYIPIPHPQPQTLMSLLTRSLLKRRNSGPVMPELVILTSDPMAGLWTLRGKGAGPVQDRTTMQITLNQMFRAPMMVPSNSQFFLHFNSEFSDHSLCFHDFHLFDLTNSVLSEFRPVFRPFNDYSVFDIIIDIISELRPAFLQFFPRFEPMFPFLSLFHLLTLQIPIPSALRPDF